MVGSYWYPTFGTKVSMHVLSTKIFVPRSWHPDGVINTSILAPELICVLSDRQSLANHNHFLICNGFGGSGHIILVYHGFLFQRLIFPTVSMFLSTMAQWLLRNRAASGPDSRTNPKSKHNLLPFATRL